MASLTAREILGFCSIKVEDFQKHRARMPFRVVADSAELGQVMSAELLDIVIANNKRGAPTRAIIPCGPLCWHEFFCSRVNTERISLQNVSFFHMDECLDWQGRLLPDAHPFNFRATMQRLLYQPIDAKLNVPERSRFFLQPDNLSAYKQALAAAPIDLCLGGWGQDGHIAYNQARREPYSPVSIAELESCETRIQTNNFDTLLALAHRNFGAAYQLVPPMSVTIGIKECLQAKRIRLFSDTGAWKQTAFRVALFGHITPEYPLTLLQKHPDAAIVATLATATHPCSLHPEWQFFAEQ